MRPAAATAVLGVALAVGVPTAWSLTRPPASAGAPVEQVLQSPPAPLTGRPSGTAAPTLPGTPPDPDEGRGTAGVRRTPAPVRLTVPRLGSTPPSTPWASSPTGR